MQYIIEVSLRSTPVGRIQEALGQTEGLNYDTAVAKAPDSSMENSRAGIALQSCPFLKLEGRHFKPQGHSLLAKRRMILHEDVPSVWQ